MMNNTDINVLTQQLKAGATINMSLAMLVLNSEILALCDAMEEKNKKEIWLKEELALLANFNPDWDVLYATQESLREHMALLKDATQLNAELSDKLAREQDYCLGVDTERMELHKRIKELEASQPVAPETLPCNVLLEPGLRFGKGIKTTTLLSALERRAEYEKEAKNETPEQKEQRLKAFFELMGLAGAQTVKRSVYDSEKWQLVPIEPTEDMIVDGFESEPHEAFSSEGGWREYQEMSGCSKAAHRAKLCWAAMLDAAPALPEGD